MNSIQEYVPHYFDHTAFMSLNYLQFRRERTAIGYAKRELEKIEKYQHYIPLYPGAKCLPLESFYLIYRCSGALDYRLLEDFLNLGYKTGVWACWVVLITPYKFREYSDLIGSVVDLYPEDVKWLLRLAALSCRSTSDDHQLVRGANRISYYLLQMPKLLVPLREYPTEDDRRRLERRAVALRGVYRDKGADAALDYLQGHREIWDLSYEDWRRLFVEGDM